MSGMFFKFFVGFCIFIIKELKNVIKIFFIISSIVINYDVMEMWRRFSDFDNKLIKKWVNDECEYNVEWYELFNNKKIFRKIIFYFIWSRVLERVIYIFIKFL